MARSTNDDLSGRIGNLIYYQRDGKTYVRRRPTGKRSGGTEEERAQQDFALASKYGSALLNRLKAELYHKLKLTDHNRLRGWINKQLRARQADNEWKITSVSTSCCSIHGAENINNSMLVPVTFAQLPGGDVQVQVPAFVPAQQIIAPPNAISITLKMMLVGSAFAGHSPTKGFDSKEWSFPWRYAEQPAQEFTLSAGLQPGDIMLLVLAIHYTVVERMQELPCQDRKYALAAIVGMGRV